MKTDTKEHLKAVLSELVAYSDTLRSDASGEALKNLVDTESTIVALSHTLDPSDRAVVLESAGIAYPEIQDEFVVAPLTDKGFDFFREPERRGVRLPIRLLAASAHALISQSPWKHLLRAGTLMDRCAIKVAGEPETEMFVYRSDDVYFLIQPPEKDSH